ncbi:MAG: hypothetical protein HY217_03140 [Candidatus Rokubacteria bacterium]|nr:hypothetical protein [Candidatus Rokubacteria bacterium]
MPFAPVVMAEHAGRCFTGTEGAEDAARFMTITFDCTEWMAKTRNPSPIERNVDRSRIDAYLERHGRVER